MGGKPEGCSILAECFEDLEEQPALWQEVMKEMVGSQLHN